MQMFAGLPPRLHKQATKRIHEIDRAIAMRQYEDAMERPLLLAKIKKGLRQADAGQTLSHDKVKQKRFPKSAMRAFAKSSSTAID